MKQSHYEKYDALAHKLGWADVLGLVPFSPEKVRQALDSGDEHLNSLPLASWDRAALGNPLKSSPCPTCGHGRPYKQPLHGCDGPMAELFRKSGLGHSLSDGICVLKHVAKVTASQPA